MSILVVFLLFVIGIVLGILLAWIWMSRQSASNLSLSTSQSNGNGSFSRDVPTIVAPISLLDKTTEVSKNGLVFGNTSAQEPFEVLVVDSTNELTDASGRWTYETSSAKVSVLIDWRLFCPIDCTFEFYLLGSDTPVRVQVEGNGTEQALQTTLESTKAKEHDNNQTFFCMLRVVPVRSKLFESVIQVRLAESSKATVSVIKYSA
jgi:hypothetical protein